MYRFNSDNSVHKKSKKAQADRWTDRQKQTTSTNYKLTRKHTKTYKNWQLKKNKR